MLIDSNLIIYAASGSFPDLVSWFLENILSVSAVSMVETLGYHNLPLATHNTEDFEWIDSLELLDPLRA